MTPAPLVRGSNPIWYEVDLTAHAFDDTFYLFVLDNEIPYGPLPVWQDPFGNIPWTNPIRFLANGTLPNNIYFDPNTVYRLEFRQGPTQNDPLIYLVENYVPGSSSTVPIVDTTTATDNQISNPQFALINFTSPLTLNSITGQVIQVAPDWFLNLTGSGNVTLNQVTLNSTTIDPTNASYALEIKLDGGWTNAYLSQRFKQNGILWANTFVSSSITALSGNANENISAILVDSQGHPLATVLNTTELTETLTEYPGIGTLGASSNTDFPPTAYIEYQLRLPNICDITISSIQLISGNQNVERFYEQTTIERQIDHTYHSAYPIVPVGSIIAYGGFGVPAHYVQSIGQALSRTTFNLLFEALTHVETVTLASSNTFTVANGSMYRIGMPVEGNGIPAATGIANIVGNTITISNAATVSGLTPLRFFAALNGDGSTTFNVYNLSDYVIAGTGGTAYLPANQNGIGAIFGAANHAITTTEMPNHNHPGSTVQVFGTGGGGTLATPANVNPSAATSVSVAPQGDGVAMSLAQLTSFMTYCIRFE